MSNYCTVGYTYKQKWSMDGKTGDTSRAIIHVHDDSNAIVRTNDYKLCPDFVETVGRKKGSERLGAPMFDQFGRLCGFMAVVL